MIKKMLSAVFLLSFGSVMFPASVFSDTLIFDADSQSHGVIPWAGSVHSASGADGAARRQMPELDEAGAPIPIRTKDFWEEAHHDEIAPPDTDQKIPSPAASPDEAWPDKPVYSEGSESISKNAVSINSSDTVYGAVSLGLEDQDESAGAYVLPAYSEPWDPEQVRVDIVDRPFSKFMKFADDGTVQYFETDCASGPRIVKQVGGDDSRTTIDFYYGKDGMLERIEIGPGEAAGRGGSRLSFDFLKGSAVETLPSGVVRIYKFELRISNSMMGRPEVYAPGEVRLGGWVIGWGGGDTMHTFEGDEVYSLIGILRRAEAPDGTLQHFDERGRIVKQVSGGYPRVIFRFSYDSEGNLAEITKTTQGRKGDTVVRFDLKTGIAKEKGPRGAVNAYRFELCMRNSLMGRPEEAEPGTVYFGGWTIYQRESDGDLIYYLKGVSENRPSISGDALYADEYENVRLAEALRAEEEELIKAEKRKRRA